MTSSSVGGWIGGLCYPCLVSETPLSDRISALLERPCNEAFSAFAFAFLEATVGVEALGLPEGLENGEKYEVGADADVRLPRVESPDGHPRLRACADPAAFTLAFPETKLTALMTGRQLLDLALRDDTLDGVLVCSARTSHSVPITRNDAVQLLGAVLKPKRPWWRLW